MINCDNFETVENQTIPLKIFELLKKNDLPKLQNLRRKTDRVRFKEKNKFLYEAIHFVQTSNITEDNNLVNFGVLVIAQ